MGDISGDETFRFSCHGRFQKGLVVNVRKMRNKMIISFCWGSSSQIPDDSAMDQLT